jgi:hypothetical protein
MGHRVLACCIQYRFLHASNWELNLINSTERQIAHISYNFSNYNQWQLRVDNNVCYIRRILEASEARETEAGSVVTSLLAVKYWVVKCAFQLAAHHLIVDDLASAS